MRLCWTPDHFKNQNDNKNRIKLVLASSRWCDMSWLFLFILILCIFCQAPSGWHSGPRVGVWWGGTRRRRRRRKNNVEIRGDKAETAEHSLDIHVEAPVTVAASHLRFIPLCIFSSAWWATDQINPPSSQAKNQAVMASTGAQQFLHTHFHL